MAAIKGNTGAATSLVVNDQPVPPVRRFGGLQQQQQPQPQPQRRISGGGSVASGNSRGGSDSIVQVDVKGKVCNNRSIIFIASYCVRFGQTKSKIITMFVDQRLGTSVYQNCWL